MQYFFILGNNPTLSIAELSAVFGLKDYQSTGQIIGNNIFILKTDKIINASELIKKLGGVIKIGLIKSTSKPDKENILKETKTFLNPGEGKFKFGISYYGKNKFNIKPLAMEIKKHLKEQNVNCRWVTSKEPALSSVVVEQNKLTSGGIEIVLIKKGNHIFIGQTLSVQPFKELSFRDYGRPARDDRSGMLPPKLAQIMINLSGAVETRHALSLLDPFCGSGTILTEAMLMGYKRLIGADISKKAIKNTRENIQWIKKNYELRIMNYELLNKDAVGLSKFIKPNSVDAIITEPYLGPQRGRRDIKKTIKELEDLYSKSLGEFKKILKPDGRIVIIFPVFCATRDKQYMSPDLDGLKIINPIPKNLQNNKILKLTSRNTIIYGREGQKIWREIVILSNSSCISNSPYRGPITS